MQSKRYVRGLELLLGVGVLAVVGSIAVPRFGAADQPPSDDALLSEHLRVMRIAIVRYYQDHHAYPGQHGDGRHPGGTPEAVVSQLTLFTDAFGRASAVRDATFCFGPYLRDGIPPCTVGARSGQRGLHAVPAGRLPGYVGDPEVGWVYHCQTGQIAPNAREKDAAGRSYATY